MSDVCKLFEESKINDNSEKVLFGAGIITPTSVKFEIYPVSRNKIKESPHSYIHHKLITEKFGYDSNELYYRIITVRQELSFEEKETEKKIYYYMPKYLTRNEINELKKEIKELKKIDGLYIGAIVYDIDPRENDEYVMRKVTEPKYRKMYDNKNLHDGSIEEMMKILEENVVEEGYIIGIGKKNRDLGGCR